MSFKTWIFSDERLAENPSRKAGMEVDTERENMLQAANFIEDIAYDLKINQLTSLTAIVFVQRFYVFHSMKEIPPKDLAIAALMSAIKCEFQHCRAVDVWVHAFRLLHRKILQPNTKEYEQVEEYFYTLEELLIPTLGFDTYIQHPHSIIFETCKEMKIPKEPTSVAYGLATMSLHVTDWCLRFQPSVVACVCIYMASSWTQWENDLFQKTENWTKRVDENVSQKLLWDLEKELLESMVKNFPQLPKIPGMNAKVLKLMVETAANFASNCIQELLQARSSLSPLTPVTVPTHSPQSRATTVHRESPVPVRIL